MRGGWALAAVLLWAAGCGGGARETDDAIPPVSLAAVRSIDLVERIEATGQLLAKQEAEVAAEVGGRVTEIAIDEGRAAQAGETVLRIDPEKRRLEVDAARARLDQARAQLAESRRDYERLEELAERGVASQTQLDTARTNHKLAGSRLLAAQAELGVAERALRDAEVVAPFSGMLARRHVSRGEYVSPGQALFDLVSLDPIEVEFHLTEVDSSRVREGHRVEVSVAPFPKESFAGVVTVVSPTMDPRTRTLRVKAELDNSEARLRPGLFARVDLGIATRQGVPMLPEEAVLRRSDGAVVFRLGEGNRVERLLVETGVTRGGSVEVAGLRPGDLVVSRGHAALADGDVVDPRNPDGTRRDAPISDVAEVAPGEMR